MSPGFVRINVRRRAVDEKAVIGGVSTVSIVDGRSYEPLKERYGEARAVALARLFNAGKHGCLTKKDQDLLHAQTSCGVDGAGLGMEFADSPLTRAMQAEADAESVLWIGDGLQVRTRGPAYCLSWREGGFAPVLVDGVTGMYERCADLIVPPVDHEVLDAWTGPEVQEFFLWSLSCKMLELASGASIGSIGMQTLAAVHALRRTLFEVTGRDPYSSGKPFSMTHAWNPPKHANLAIHCAGVIEAMLDDPACSHQWEIIGMKMNGVEAIREHMGVFDLGGIALS